MRIVPSGPQTPINDLSISAMSEPYQLRDDLAVPGGVAERHLGALRALEVDVHVVLPREADAAVDLDALAGGVTVGVGAVGLRHCGRERRLGDVVRDRPRGVVRRRLRALDLDEHVGAFVLDRLEAADRPAELLAHLRVLDRHLEDALRAAAHLGAETDLAAIDDAVEELPALARVAEHAVAGD